MKTLIKFVVILCIFAAGCQTQSKKWESINLKNDLIEVQVVPDIGGRIIQYKLGNHEFFWVNKDLAGTMPPPSRLGPNGEWLNYGGDKLWPAPQGWDNNQQWPGPPDPVLDGGPYNALIYEDKDRPIGINLTSLPDKKTGIQLSRLLTIFDDTTHISIDASMKNIDTQNRRWGIWAVTQFDTANKKDSGYNKNFWAFCPLNPKSKFENGYKVMFGPEDNPTFQPDKQQQMMKVRFQYQVGKIGLDSSAGWIATVDGTAGYVFVHQFNFKPDMPYPDNSSVEFWSNGAGEFTAWGKVNKMSDDPKENPYLLESEILSPFADLQPGKSFNFRYTWAAAKIPSNCEVISCGDVGAVCKPLAVNIRDGKLNLEGTFGVFYKASCAIVFLNAKNKEIAALPQKISVTPLKTFALSRTIKLGKTGVPENAAAVALYLKDKTGRTIGELARAPIQNP